MVENIAWLGHDSFRIEGSRTVYIDPWKLGRGAPPADVILVTHAHYDHLNKDDIAALSKAGTVVVGPREVTSQLSGETRTIAVGQTIKVNGVTVSAVPAYNTDKFRAPGEVFHPQADGKVGYIVALDGRTIYHAGDTDVIPEMSAIDVDVALLPVSGTYVMTAEEAAEACDRIKAGVVVPMHYGDIVGSLDDARRFKERCSLPVEILEKSSR
jgi:L-ascorbate metabolism protein UlaG (beta-lactamase superfamily)